MYLNGHVTTFKCKGYLKNCGEWQVTGKLCQVHTWMIEGYFLYTLSANKGTFTQGLSLSQLLIQANKASFSQL